jgi:hypothetical protein
VELRVLKTGLAEAIRCADGKGPGVYIHLNPVKSALLCNGFSTKSDRCDRQSESEVRNRGRG